MSLIDNVRLVRKISHIAKNGYSIGKIADLFVQAGANIDWISDEEPTGTREYTVHLWVDAIRENTSTQNGDNIIKTLVQILIDDGLNEQDTFFLQVTLVQILALIFYFQNTASSVRLSMYEINIMGAKSEMN